MKRLLFDQSSKLTPRDMINRQVFSLIFRKPGISRTELQNKTSLGKNSITRIIDEMLASELLIEGDACNDGGNIGRKRIGLLVNPDLFYIISAVFSVEESEISLINAKGKTIQSYELNHAGSKQSQLFLTEILEKSRKLLALVNPSQVLGASIALSGIFDFDSGEVYSSQAFFMQKEIVNLKKLFREELSMEVMLFNITNMMAANERYYGAAKVIDNFVSIDEGLGMGMYMNGKLYRGWQGNAGELGFIKLSEGTQPGLDGRSGLLYDKAIFQLIGQRLFSVMNNGANMQIDKNWKPDEYLPPKAVVKAINEGNLFLAQLLSEIFSHIGDAVVNVAYLLNPEAIFLPLWCKECPQYTIDVVRMKMGSYGLSNWHLKSNVICSEAKSATRSKALAQLFLEDVMEKLENDPNFFLTSVDKK